jgi:hypothetical protein
LAKTNGNSGRWQSHQKSPAQDRFPRDTRDTNLHCGSVVAYLEAGPGSAQQPIVSQWSHDLRGYAESLILALLVPQRYLEMLTRAAEYAHQTDDFLSLLSTAFEKMWAGTNVIITSHLYNNDQVIDQIEDA